MNLTRGQAACMFFHQEFNEANEAKLLTKIDNIGDVDLCYEKNPTEPVLLYIPKIHSNPFRFHRYLVDSKPSQPPEQRLNNEQTNVSRTSRRLSSIPHIVHFLNEVFLSYDPSNEEVYEYRECTPEMILEVACRHTTMFDDKNTIAFGKWCSGKKLHFMKVNQKRKRNNVRIRPLYVLKENFMESIVEKVIAALQNHQASIRAMKHEEYQIVGYCRKSPGDETAQDRLRLIQHMAARLRERSLVDKVFVSFSCKSSQRISERDGDIDKKSTEALNKFADGSMQDLLSYLSSTKKVCLVIVDYAGLSTNAQDLHDFISNHENLKKIIVDHLPYENDVKVFDREELLDIKNLEVFNCRKGNYHRSK